MKRIITTTLYGLLILMLGSIAALFVVPLLPIENNVQVKIVKSGSMEPYIETGGIVVIKPTNYYAVGDVITFKVSEEASHPTTHRILSTSESGGEIIYETKGDANEEADPKPVRQSDVIGKVIFTAPKVGYILDFSKQPLGFILLIGIPAALVILYELFDIAKEIKKVWRRRKGEDEEKEETHVWKRVHQMDDVMRPIREIIVKKSEKNFSSMAVFAVLLGAGFVLSNPPSTASYFLDDENSLENTTSAASFNIEATVLGIEYYVGESDSSSIESVVDLNPGGAPHEYKVKVEKKEGSDAFCQALLMSSSDTPPFVYDGPLLNFVSPPTSFSGNWQFEVSLEADAAVNQEDVCTIEMVYSAGTWFTEEGLYGGYSDEARTSVTFKVAEHNYANARVVEEAVEAVVEELIIEEKVEKTVVEVVEETPAVTEIVEEVEELIETEKVVEEVIEEVAEEEVAPESELAE